MQLELGRIEEEDLTAKYGVSLLRLNPTVRTHRCFSEASEHKLYQGLLALAPGLEERLNTGSDNDVHYVADMVRTPFRMC